MKLLLLLTALTIQLGIGGCATTASRDEMPSGQIPPTIPASGEKPSADAAEPQDTRGQAPPPTEQSGAQLAELAELSQIRSLYISGKCHTSSANTLSATGAALKFHRKYPKSLIKGHVLNIEGLCHIEKKEPLQAMTKFRRALEVSDSDDILREYVLYNLASAQFQAGQNGDVQTTLDSMTPSRLDLHTKLKFFFLKSLLNERLSLPALAARDLLDGSMTFTEITPDRTLASYQTQLSQVLALITNPSPVEELYSNYSSSPLADLLLFRLGVLSKANDQTDSAERHFKNLITKFPESPHYLEAADFVRAIQHSSIVDPKAVGILLPLTGKYQRFGQQCLQSITLAFKVFDQKALDNKVQLIVEDSGETPQQAIQALNKLYFDHHVVAVVGPLLSKGVEEVTERAEELGLPMLVLSQKLGKTADYVFYSAVTPKNQAYAVAKYAVEQKKLRKFAILHPHDDLGKEYANHFWDAVDQLGGDIVASEAYVPGQTDFRQAVDKLSGLYYQEAREREAKDLERQRKENKITKRTFKSEKFFKLEPIVEYEAVFIPDEARTIGQAIPTFAYRDVENVTFLGISTWNSPNLIARAGDLAENSLFVDTFFLNSKFPSTKRFVVQFENAFGRQPTSLEAMAYDASLTLEHALLTLQGSASRAEIRDRLASLKNFPGIGGKISFEEGRLLRPLKLITVQNKQFKLVN